MTKTEKGSPDSVNVRKYEKGRTYDLPTELADVFLNDLECCELAKDESETEENTEEDSEEDTPAKKSTGKNKKKNK